MKFTVAIVVFALILPAFYVNAQVITVRPMDLSPTLDSLFTNGEFEQMEMVALRMLHPSRQSSEEEKVAAHLYLGFAWELSRRSNDAQNAFLQALEIRPNLTLDQVYVPPALYSAFNRAKNFKDSRSDLYVPVQHLPSSPKMPPHHIVGSLSNLFVPGSGFIVSGRQPLRGVFWFTAQAGCAYALLNAYNKEDEARKDYQNEMNPTKIEKRYEEYNDWNKTLQLWAGITGGVYVFSQIDFQMSGFKVKALPITGIKDQSPIIGMRLNFSW